MGVEANVGIRRVGRSQPTTHASLRDGIARTLVPSENVAAVLQPSQCSAPAAGSVSIKGSTLVLACTWSIRPAQR